MSQIKFYNGSDISKATGEVGAVYITEGATYPRIYIGENKTPIGQHMDKLLIGNSTSAPNYSIVGGTNDKAVITGLVGSTAASLINVSEPTSNAPCTISVGSSTKVTSTGGNAIGVMNTSGVTGYYYTNIDFDKKQFTLSTKRGSSATWSGITLDWAVNDTISFVNESKYPISCKITAISSNIITVDSLPFSSADKIVSYNVLNSTSYTPDDFTIFACYEKPEVTILGSVKNKRWYPRNGLIELGWAATAFGVENLVTGSGSFSAGWNNWSAGDFSATFGRDNVSGYASLVAGSKNTVSSNNTLTVGSSNTVNSAGGIIGGSGSTVSSGNAIVGGANHTLTNGASCTVVGGDGNTLIGAWCSAVFGNGNTVSNQFNLIGGKNNKSISHCNIMAGESNTANDNDSAIFGQGNTSNAPQTFMCAYNSTIATGCGESAVFGNNNVIGSDTAITLPDGTTGTKINLNNSAVFGKNNKMYGSNAFMAGQANIIWNGNSTVFGYNNTAKSASTLIAGDGNISTQWCQAVFGRYNDYSETGNDLLVIGNGKSISQSAYDELSDTEKAKYTKETTNTGGTTYTIRDNAFRVTSGGTAIATKFQGNGSLLTSLNASNLSSGTIDINRIPTGVEYNTVARGNHTHSYLPLSGGALTGKITLPGGKYYNNEECAIDLKNSDIIGINGLWFQDASDTTFEGINFYRDSTSVSSFFVSDYQLKFTPNQPMNTTTRGTTYYVTRTSTTNGTVGSSTTPVYVNAGTITACGSSLNVNITGTSAQANTLKTNNKHSSGTLTAPGAYLIIVKETYDGNSYFSSGIITYSTQFTSYGVLFSSYNGDTIDDTAIRQRYVSCFTNGILTFEGSKGTTEVLIAQYLGTLGLT